MSRRGGGRSDRLNKSYSHFSAKKQKSFLSKNFASSAERKFFKPFTFVYILSLCFVFVSGLAASSLLSPMSNLSTTSDVTASEWPSTSNITWNSEVLNGHTFYYTYLGEWPQTYVGDKLNNSFDMSLIGVPQDITGLSGNLDVTGKQYTINENVWTEYSYNGGKYVKGNQKLSSTTFTFKNGASVGNDGDSKWFKVEPIKWWVVDGNNPNDEQEVTVISDVSLTDINFNLSYEDGNSWENSVVRTFANGEFYEKSNLKAAGSTVKNSTVKTKAPGAYDFPPSDSDTITLDYVWIPSYYEMTNIFCPETDTEGKYYLRSHRGTTADESRMASPSDFAIANNGGCNSSYISDYRKGTTNYWLRSAGNYHFVCLLFSSGDIDVNQRYIDMEFYGFRPAITLVNIKTINDFDDGIEFYPGITKNSSNSYMVTDVTGLEALSDFTNAGGKLNSTDIVYIANNIDCAGKTLKPITNFNFIIDGQDHSIFNLNIAGEKYGGFVTEYLIESSRPKASPLRNIKFLGTSVSGTITGALFGRIIYPSRFSTSLTINVALNVYFEGDLDGTNIGGLVGEISNGSGLPGTSYQRTMQFTNVQLNARVKSTTNKVANAIVGVNETAERISLLRAAIALRSNRPFSAGDISVVSSNDAYIYVNNFADTSSQSIRKFYGHFNDYEDEIIVGTGGGTIQRPIWYYSKTLNGGLPVLRRFFWLDDNAGEINGARIESQLKSLDFVIG